MGERQGFVLPLLYVLLPSKSEAIYTKMWKMIQTLWPEFNPTTANLDYEVALMNSLKTVFPGIQLGGCLFHLVKNMKKHLGTNKTLAILLYGSQVARQLYKIFGGKSVSEWWSLQWLKQLDSGVNSLDDLKDAQKSEKPSHLDEEKLCKAVEGCHFVILLKFFNHILQ
uniref:MULE transposase domain-containing protein n=1 Tax=Ditylenchus dipsaci TaxID=166011 RepID=A0A915CRI3_9BILA